VARAGGQLQAGGEVKTGDTLIEIDPFDYQISLANSRAQLDEAKAKLIETAASIGVEQGNLQSAREQLQLAQTDLQRALPLAQRGAISTRTVDDRRLLTVQRQQAVTQSLNTLRVWQARKMQQEAAVNRLEATVAQARKRLKETVLTAPFSAFVTDVGAQVGRMLNVNDRVATLIDRDWIDARFTLSDRQYGRLMGTGRGLVGRQVDVRWNVGASPLSYPAKIERVDGRVSTEDGGIAIYARIQDPRRPVQIRPGTFVEVRLSDKTFERVAKVSSQAVYNGDTVYVVVDGRLQARKVSIVGTSGSDLLVEGEIKEGEQMLLTRLARPGNGVRIKGLDSNGA